MVHSSAGLSCFVVSVVEQSFQPNELGNSAKQPVTSHRCGHYKYMQMQQAKHHTLGHHSLRVSTTNSCMQT